MPKTSRIETAAALALALAVATTPIDAGSLTPPGSPAPTDKHLTTIEPRTIISAATTPGDANSVYQISQPGSYYLGGNVTGASSKSGIEINVDNVTVDLNGFSVIGVTGALSGVVSSPGTKINIHVMNGTITSWPRYGLDLGGTGGHASDLSVHACAFGGIQAGPSSVIRNCSVTSNGGDGISVSGQSVVEGCSVTGNDGDGVAVSTGSIVSHCALASNTGRGIVASSGSIVSGNSIHSTAGDGVFASDYCRIVGNTVRGPGAAAGQSGIRVTGAGTRVEDNEVYNFAFGYNINAHNFTVRNTASGNGTDYSFVAPTTYGEVVNGAGGFILTGSPWANLRL